MELIFIPHKELSVVEFLSYISNSYLHSKKHHKWGVKFWTLCNSIVNSVENYCFFFCSDWAESNIDKVEIKNYDLDYIMVIKLLGMCNYLNKAFHIFMDDLFTSTSLIKYLYNNSDYLTGTIGRNRKGLPNIVKLMREEIKKISTLTYID